ncbi:hypothetical protein F4818DRAFT_409236 [Hypoxylon cercidicola]|nr:hypothetical protein F4818DRAFT_409236 [Hypoxylon cercidicola]
MRRRGISVIVLGFPQKASCRTVYGALRHATRTLDRPSEDNYLDRLVPKIWVFRLLPANPRHFQLPSAHIRNVLKKRQGFWTLWCREVKRSSKFRSLGYHSPPPLSIWLFQVTRAKAQGYARQDETVANDEGPPVGIGKNWRPKMHSMDGYVGSYLGLAFRMRKDHIPPVYPAASAGDTDCITT